MTFSSACSIVIATQLLNYKEKEEREFIQKQQEKQRLGKGGDSLFDSDDDDAPAEGDIELIEQNKDRKGGSQLSKTNVGKSKKAKREQTN